MFLEIYDLNLTISWVLREPWSSCADPEVSSTDCDTTMKAFHVLWMILNVFTLQWRIRKNFDEKIFFIEISDPNLTFFRDLWRILRPSGLFSYAYYWLKYNFRSFTQSLDDAKHVRIDLMNIKNFFGKKVFIEISDPNLTFPTESIWENLTTCQLWVSKKIFETFYQKSASTVLSGLIWRTD